MEVIPDDVLLHIFCALNRESLCLGVRMVCTRWRQLTFDPSLWRYVIIPDHYTDRRLYLLLNQIHEHVVELEMSNCNCLTSDGFTNISLELDFPKLKRIAVPISTTLPNDIYELLAKACPVLEETENIRSTYSGDCNPLGCQQLFPCLRTVHDKPVSTYGRLRKIHTDQDVTKLDRWVADLNETARFCPNITAYKCNRGMEFIDAKGLEAVSVAFPHLTSLELRNCLVDDESIVDFFVCNKSSCGLVDITFDKPGALTDYSLLTIADNCPRLNQIKISRCCKITNKGIQYLVAKCQMLTDLHINNAIGYFEESNHMATKDDITDETVSHIAYTLPQLSFLRIFYSSVLSHVGVECIVAGCANLYGLMLYECGGVDDAALEAIQCLRFLKVLILVGCNNMTPEALINVVLHSPTLNRLTFYTKNHAFYGDMSDLADEVYTQIDDITSNFKPNAIHKLAFRGIGAGFLQLVTVLCPNLITMDLRDTCHVSNRSLVSVLQNCEDLENLDITSMGHADDIFLNGCINYGQRLRLLSLGGSVGHMSMEKLGDVIETCPSLRMVSMDVTDTKVDEDLLVNAVKKHHGGHCFMYVDDEEVLKDDLPKQRYIELHFTPLKYLGSINAVPLTPDPSDCNTNNHE